MTAIPDLDFGEFDSEFILPDPVETDQLDPEAPQPDTGFVEEPAETARAKRYRLKVKHGLNFVMRVTAEHPSTVADSAAIIMHGPDVAKAVGNLADHDKRVRAAIDFITDDAIDNPYVLAAITVLPMAFQILRNHEHQLDKEVRPSIRLPRGRRLTIPFLRFRLRFKLIHQATETPGFITQHVFSNPAIRSALAKQDINLAWSPNMNGRH
jgi:hypothetical protein